VLCAHAEGRLNQAHFIGREHLAPDPPLPLFGRHFFRRHRLGSFVRRRERRRRRWQGSDKDVTRSPPLPQGGRANGASAGAGALHGDARAFDPKGGRQVARGERAIESQVTERLHGHRRDGSDRAQRLRQRICWQTPVLSRSAEGSPPQYLGQCGSDDATPCKIKGCLQADNSQSSGVSTSTRIAEPGPSGPSSERYRAEGCLAS
jgi:hypothetical protein